MTNFRIVKRDRSFYPQAKKYFLFWLYITDIPNGIECNDFLIDKYDCVGFKKFEDAKKFLHDLANSKRYNKTKVVYELEEEEND